MLTAVCTLLLAFASVSLGTYSTKTLRYLEQFGYLPKPSGAAAMLSQTVVEEAIRELQLYGNVPVTGKVDAATRELMSRKRCGLPDRQMNRHRRKHRKRYALMGTRWDKKLLTYSVDNPSRSIPNVGDVRREVNEAINAWRHASALHLNEVRSEADADIRIRFAVGDHGDPYHFDGTGRILAHAFPPGEGLGGDVHLDDDERWTNAVTGDPHSQQVSLRSIVMHEIGHSLGLSHSLQQDSIMYSFYQYDLPPQLSYDDIMAIQSIYGRGHASAPRRPTLPPKTTTTTRPLLLSPSPGPSPEIPTDTNNDEMIAPDPCTSDVDAITEIRGEVFAFKGDWFWRIHHDGRLSEGPRPISSFWESLPSPIDAAVEENDRILFFIGKKLYVYNGHQQESVKPLTALGLPEHVDHIRLVYSWNYWTEKPIYIWTDDEFWRVDKKSGKVEIGYPRKISTTWHYVPKEANAALTFNDDLYFFAGTNVFKFHSINMSATEAQHFSQFWGHCPTAMRISSGTTGSLPLNFTYYLLVILVLFILIK